MISKNFQNLNFIILKKGEKLPYNKNDWNNNIINYTVANEYLLKGYNIGVVAGIQKENNKHLIIIDADSKDFEEYCDDALPKTLTERTCSGGKHYFFYIKNKNKLNNCVIKGHLGEVRVEREYVVITPSVAKNKNNEIKKYELINDVEIKEVGEEIILNLIEHFNTTLFNKPAEEYLIKKDFNKKELNEVIKTLNNSFVKNLILNDYSLEELKNLGFNSRSERDAKIISYLLLNRKHEYIYSIFNNFPCGNKYKEHPAPDKYLIKTIESSIHYLGLRKKEDLDLEFDIENNININILKNHLDEYLLKINNIEDNDNLFKERLLSTLSYKLKLNKNLLINRLNELLEDNKEINLFELSNMKYEKKEYILRPLIPKNCLIMLASKPGSGKSLFIHGMINYIIFKNEFLNFKCEVPNLKIIYYSIDDNNEETLCERQKYILNGLELEKQDIINNLKNVKIKFSFNFNTMNKEIKECMNYDLIIIDSYRRVLKGEENNSEITTIFYNNFLKKLKNNKKTIILLHHLKKGDIDDIENYNLIDSIRGSSDITSQMDLIYLLKNSKNIFSSNNLISNDYFISIVKNRLAIPIKPINYKVIKNDNDIDNNLNFYTKFVVDNDKYISIKDKRQSYIKEYIKQKGGSLKRNEIIEYFSTNMDVSKITIIKDLDELIKTNELKKDKLGMYSI